MARHAIIIGVGGTGQYVVTLIKKELMEINNGKVPSNVRLLAFDTMPEAAAGGNQNLPENIISIGNVQLERNVQFHPLSGNGWEVGEKVVKNEAEHIGKKVDRRSGYTWFDAEEYRRTIPVALWDLAAGAGRIRQFGRLSFFLGIDNVILPRLQQAFNAVRANLDKNQELEVILVSSFAGGTGAGMFVDMGVLCRDLGRGIGNQMIIRGFFVLPRVFANPQDRQEETRWMMARSFATWRELDRFMNLGPDYGAHKINYRDQNQLDISVNARPFDVCYLVDSRSANHSLETTKAEHGVFPAIANYISLILDEQAGPPYSQDTRNYIRNLGRDKPGYCAFRTHTIKVPIYYDLENCAHSFSKDMLETWLVPVRDTKKNITGLADNTNNEMPNTQGRDQVYSFLESTTFTENAILNRMSAAEVTQGTNLLNTMLFPHISYIYKLRNNPARHAEQVENDAVGGLSQLGEDGSLSPTTYIGKLTLLPGDANHTKVEIGGRWVEPDVQNVMAEASVRIWDEVKPSDEIGEHPLDALNRFKDPVDGILAFERKHYGAGAGNKGKFGEILEVAYKFQHNRFRELLRIWLINVLNGIQVDPKVGLCGKLGYVNDFCNELVKTIDFFRTYLDEVKQKRDNKGLNDAAIYSEDNARQEMENWAGRKCIFFFGHPRAHVKQQEYLQAVDTRNQVRKDDLLLDTLIQLSTDLLAEARKTQEAVGKWVAGLGTGGQNIVGLMRDVTKQSEVIASTLQQEKLEEETQFMMDEVIYTPEPLKVTQELRRLSWKIDIGQSVDIRVQALVPSEEVDAAGNPVNEPIFLKSGDTQADLEHNRDAMLKISRNVYRGLKEQRYVLDEVISLKRFGTGMELANTLKDYSDVLVDLSANANRQRHQRQVYLRTMNPSEAKNPNAVQYLQDTKNQLCATLGVSDGQGYRTLDSQDKYKMTLLHTTYRVQDTDFALWSTLRDHYLAHIHGSANIENAARLHIFPAECNAARYESKLTPLLSKAYRPFHPRVVMLLEHAGNVSLFFRCLAYGFIKQRENPATGEKSYLLDVPKIGNNIPQTDIVLVTNMDTGGNIVFNEWPTTFDVVHAFALVGHDAINPQRIINYSQLNNSINLHEDELKRNGELGSKVNKQILDGVVFKLRQIRDEKRQIYLNTHPGLPTGGWTWEDDGQDYEDLADLSEMMFKDVLQGQTPEIEVG